MSLDRPAAERRLERTIGRLLAVGTTISVALLASGVALMFVAGVDPLGGGAPALDPARLPGDLAALRSTGLLWAGLAVIIATPSGRVIAALVGYLLEQDPRMAAVALAILAVIGLSVALALGTGL